MSLGGLSWTSPVLEDNRDTLILSDAVMETNCSSKTSLLVFSVDGEATRLPHSFGGAVVEVLQQLRHAQHGLERHGERTQSLHKNAGVHQQQGDHGTQHGQAEAEEQVVFKRTPLPEVLKVQVWTGGNTHGQMWLSSEKPNRRRVGIWHSGIGMSRPAGLLDDEIRTRTACGNGNIIVVKTFREWRL